MRVLYVVGTRPNFMKVAPIMWEMRDHADPCKQILVHTGQHYDRLMSDVFLAELEMGLPDEFLGVGSGTHAQQTARTMLAFEPILIKHRPDWVLVVGDVNSTLACALVCSKLGVPVAHVEAGLRSRDLSMPEEINRMLTDQLSTLLFTPSEDADHNLLAEGIDPGRIQRVGNVMIDSVVRILPRARQSTILTELDLNERGYVLATLHRPSNVDDPENLAGLLKVLSELAAHVPVVFPMHPRTRQRLGAEAVGPGLRLIKPLGYVKFLALLSSARFVVTDSGGVQEETTFLGVPCLTARANTERPITITEGSNRLIGTSVADIRTGTLEALTLPHKEFRIPELWDGAAARRIVTVLQGM